MTLEDLARSLKRSANTKEVTLRPHEVKRFFPSDHNNEKLAAFCSNHGFNYEVQQTDLGKAVLITNLS